LRAGRRSEIAKLQVNRGGRPEIYYFRDQQGLEVDFVIPMRSQRLALVEAKATRTPTPAMAHSLRRLKEAITQHTPTALLVDDGRDQAVEGGALAPGCAAREAGLGNPYRSRSQLRCSQGTEAATSGVAPWPKRGFEFSKAFWPYGRVPAVARAQDSSSAVGFHSGGSEGDLEGSEGGPGRVQSTAY